MDQALWDQVTAKFVATIKRLEDKIEIDRKNLLSYKKEQQRHNLKLTNSNKRLREEKQMMGEQAMDLQNTTKILNKRVLELEAQVSKLVSSEQVALGKLQIAEKKLMKHKELEKSASDLRKELFYWEQHHTENLNATLSAVLENKDKIHKQLLKKAIKNERKKEERQKMFINVIRNDSNNISPNTSAAGSKNFFVEDANARSSGYNDLFRIEAELQWKNQRIQYLENQVEELKVLLEKTRKNEAKRYSDLERKFLSAKGINVALERQLMFRNQQADLRSVSRNSM